mgnify:CR=1 FL=1|tara:strand:+ start:2760 stop:3311 length:552 start_codon:yes stop_codon:yes gene_type:complete
MSKKSTWQIAADARHLASSFMDVADADGVVDEEAYDAWAAQLNEVSGDIRDKLHRLREVRDRVLAEAGVLKDQAERIGRKAKQRFAEVDKIKGYMRDLLIAHRELNPDETKVVLQDGFVSLVRSKRMEVEVADPSALPPELCLAAPAPKPDKAAIVAAHREGRLSSKYATVREIFTEHIREGG